MTYKNISEATIVPFENYVHKNWVDHNNANFFHKEILARGAHLVLIPASFFANALDSVIGVVLGVDACLHGGILSDLNCYSLNHARKSFTLLAGPYKHLALAVNPDLDLYSFNDHSIRQVTGLSLTNFVFNIINPKYNNFLKECSNSNFFMKHIVSRLTNVLVGIANLVTRAVDGIICLPLAALSLVTLRSFETLNELALGTLKAPAVISDLTFSCIRIVNPYAKFSE